MSMILALLAGAIILYVCVQVYIRKGVIERTPRDSAASHPGRLKPNRTLMRHLSPGLYPHSLQWSTHSFSFHARVFFARQLWHGASNPAVVVHEDPIIVAAYAADCDAVLLVRFLPESIDDLKGRGATLRTGSRLLSVNTYFFAGQERKGDEIVLGMRQTGLWSSFRPFIAEFMCTDLDAIESRKKEIASELWARTKQLGLEKLQDTNLDEVRWGNPMYVEIPRSYRTAIAYAEQWQIPF